MGTAIPNLKSAGLGEFTKYRHLPFLYHNALSTVVSPVFWRKLPKDIQDISMNEVCPEVEKRATDRILALEASMIKFAEQNVGQKEVLAPPEVFFPLLDWSVTNIWEKRVRDYPDGLPLWEEGAKLTGYTLKNGKFTGVKEAWEKYYVDVYGGVGAAMATREGKHINMEVLSRWLSGVGKTAVGALVNLFSALICALLTFAALRFLVNEAQMGHRAFLGLPAWVPEIIIPATFALMTLRFGFAFCQEAVHFFRPNAHEAPGQGP